MPKHLFVAVKILIGFNRGLIVLWDMTSNKPEHTYTTSEVIMFLLIICSALIAVK